MECRQRREHVHCYGVQRGSAVEWKERERDAHNSVKREDNVVGFREKGRFDLRIENPT